MSDENEAEDLTVQQALEAAFDAAEAPEEEEVEEEVDADEEVEDEASEGEDDSPELSDDDSTGDTELAGDEEDEEESTETTAGPVDDSVSGDTGRAPVSWTPEAREEWAKVPDKVRAEIAKREREIQETLGQTTRARQVAQAWSDAVTPYESIMAAQGARNPVEGVTSLLKVGAGLVMGNSAQKAQIIRDLIQQYQVDVPTLDAVLSGAAPAVSPEIEQIIEQRLAPYHNLMLNQQQAAQAAQQAQQAKVNAEIAEVSKREFFTDLRSDMADLLELAAKRNQSMTLTEAYDKAIKLNPSVMAVMQQREKVKNIKKSGGEVERRKAAASSVRGKPAGSSKSKGSNDSIAAALNAAWDQTTTRRTRI